VFILFLLALIIDAQTKTVDLPILIGEEINFEEHVHAKVKEEYLIYVADFNDYLFPLNIVLEKEENDGISIYEDDIKTELDEVIYTTFSLLTNYSNYLPIGVTTSIPPSTQLISYELNDRELTLNLSNSFLNYNEVDEKNIIKILTYTFTHMNAIDRVKIVCEGKKINFKSTEKVVFSQSDFALNVYFNDFNLNETNFIIIYYYTELEDNMYLVPVTVYDKVVENKEEQIKMHLTRSNSLPVISLIDENEIEEYSLDAFFDNDLKYFQYYFTFSENNIIEESKNVSIKNVNFYEIVLRN
jgi:hypothetical protein